MEPGRHKHGVFLTFDVPHSNNPAVRENHNGMGGDVLLFWHVMMIKKDCCQFWWKEGTVLCSLFVVLGVKNEKQNLVG